MRWDGLADANNMYRDLQYQVGLRGVACSIAPRLALPRGVTYMVSKRARTSSPSVDMFDWPALSLRCVQSRNGAGAAKMSTFGSWCWS